jgi:hypothetical protein
MGPDILGRMKSQPDHGQHGRHDHKANDNSTN